MSSERTPFPSHESILGSSEGTFGDPLHVESLMSLALGVLPFLKPEGSFALSFLRFLLLLLLWRRIFLLAETNIKFSNSVILRAMKVDERACSFDLDFCCFYKVFLKSWLLFPLPYAIKSTICKFRIAPSQLMPNGIKKEVKDSVFYELSFIMKNVSLKFTLFFPHFKHMDMRFKLFNY